MNSDVSAHVAYRHILVATDFSPPAEAALKQAVWLSQKTGAKITLAHCLPNIRKLLESASYEGKKDFLYGEGSTFHHEVERDSLAKMQKLIAQTNIGSDQIRPITLLGAPHLQIATAVQSEGCDLVLAGTRGMSTWQHFLIGSTAKRLVRNCPASVWIVKGETQSQPQRILAATDFSDVSRKAVQESISIANQANAELHLVHVIDSLDATEEVLSKIPNGSSLRSEVNVEAKKRFDEFVSSLNLGTRTVQQHLSYGTPWQEIGRLTKHINADLVVLGTIGRSGIRELLLGNTAEKVLDTCDCSILTVKPADFVSPIIPPFKSVAGQPKTDA
ncbi:universal stress protein [Schlesneria sp. DSM 10557]|uniref:universal stress protein n=1 Tax=Schlesneria sp. DSM 10557 TaxID=3044399 RepID=UPI0035A01BBA